MTRSDQPEWAALTKDPDKALRYADDTHFREGLSLVSRVLGDDWEKTIFDVALIVIKPDAIATGKQDIIVNYYLNHGFSFIDVEPVLIDRLTSRELWRYQHTLGTPDRLAVEDIVLQSQPSLVCIARGPLSETPATVRANALKGAADVFGKEETLRSLLERPNPLFSMLHTSDEPADLLRETAVLLPPRTRMRFLEALNRSAASSHAATLLTLSTVPSTAVRIDLNESTHRLEEVLSAFCRIQGFELVAGRALSLLRAAEAGSALPWFDFVGYLDALPVRFSPWDLAIVGSSYVASDIPGATKLVGKIGPSSW